MFRPFMPWRQLRRMSDDAGHATRGCAVTLSRNP